ncbi:ABC transporter ATP-binding protein [Streptomyces sp. NPDC032161]|uniref:ABC transporter ATP-binding protein n=1 Tax=unclassified Streptomyces TaxID=2593676 RepID=UPI0033C57150
MSDAPLSGGEVQRLGLARALAPALRSLVAVLGSWGVQLDTVLRRLGGAMAPTAPALAPGRTPLTPDISLNGVTYAYGPRAAPVISALSLDVPAGSHLVVVGPSGAGKSTLTALLAGLTLPDSGRLTVGGVPVEEIDRTWLRRTVTLIPQEAYVFTGTVRDNVRHLRLEAGDDELTASLAAVGALGLVERLGGLDASVGLDGPELSAGEKQLVALARAHASAASIVLLDEAGCHLDPAAEARAEEAFAARGTTLVVVAHRISSALRGRRILVLDGERTAVGTHGELLAASPLYGDLVGHWMAGRAVGAGAGARRPGRPAG